MLRWLRNSVFPVKMLLERGFVVHGTPRGREMSNLSRLGMRDFVAFGHPERLSERAFSRIQLTSVYDLASQASVSLSFDEPIETLDSIIGGNVEAMCTFGRGIRFYNAHRASALVTPLRAQRMKGDGLPAAQSLWCWQGGGPLGRGKLSRGVQPFRRLRNPFQS
jgi:hypothetical protein